MNSDKPKNRFPPFDFPSAVVVLLVNGSHAAICRVASRNLRFVC